MRSLQEVVNLAILHQVWIGHLGYIAVILTYNEGFAQLYYLCYCFVINSIKLVIENTNQQKESLMFISIASIFLMGLIVSYLQLSSGWVFQMTLIINTLLLIATICYVCTHLILNQVTKSLSQSLTKAGLIKEH